jgi:phthalate 4,5-dioxygenase
VLSVKDNQSITRTGPGTPMGEYLRRFWLPALATSELQQADGPPVRIKLLGEELIAFRTTSGQTALIGNACPHRGASLFFGRNEEDGLRCVYHGWKFDVTGACVDMPSEPAESNFRSKVRATAYPTLERGGLVWAYMGPPETIPELPPYEWTLVPDSHVHTSRRLQECNYLQGIEGGIDSSHVPFLHGVLDPERRAAVNQKYMYRDMAPRLRVTATDYGFAYGAQRNGEDDSYYWRFTPFLLPFFTVIPGFTVTPDQRTEDAHALTYSGHGWVPRDDETCWMVTYSWNASRPLQASEGHPAHFVKLDARTLRADVNADNDYGLNREVQRTETYTGISNGSIQDAAVQESMGPIYDRTAEHLGTSDSAVIFLRQMYLRAARSIQAGAEPFLPTNRASFRVRSVSALLDRNVPFEEGLDYMKIAGREAPEIAAT